MFVSRPHATQECGVAVGEELNANELFNPDFARVLHLQPNCRSWKDYRCHAL